MRYVSWNMGCSPQMATRYRKVHADAWGYLIETLRPDVALVQEALLASEAVVGRRGRLFWSQTRGTDSATAIYVREGLEAKAIQLTSAGSYVAAIELETVSGSQLVVSVNVGLPNELGFGCGMTCWRRLRDWNNAGVWQRLHEVLLAELRAADKLDLSRAVVGKHFVVGGDLNAARHLDVVQKGRWFTKYFDNLASRGFHDCHWSCHGKEVQSFWGPQAKNPYQCDHLFVDGITAGRVVACDVLELPTNPAFSDHSPILLKLDDQTSNLPS